MRKKKTLDRLPAEFGAVEIWRRGPHVVWQRVLDRRDPGFTRWILQRAVQRAGNLGYGSLDGVTDEAAFEHLWHGFEINRPTLVRRFLSEIAPLLRRGLIEVCLDRVAVELRGSIPPARTWRRTVAAKASVQPQQARPKRARR